MDIYVRDPKQSLDRIGDHQKGFRPLTFKFGLGCLFEFPTMAAVLTETGNRIQPGFSARVMWDRFDLSMTMKSQDLWPAEDTVARMDEPPLGQARSLPQAPRLSRGKSPLNRRGLVNLL
ncbi:hypothetical protein MCOR27_003536 [Pyricularia oryzae]|uniref:Uncharacterized protein n=1 Tax=Pyricularia grisea TaxID=148305 RepID=A0ABQ8NC75_PYRGI|nr:hypothetical protein MCOR01_006814 [Pyricularia oryzae]KAI6293449.1 hypothetical protein MCOR33_009128 [Pyricularia grisea]KAH9434636.1 hypothetical protein MCOR02_006631 [Pyricularia oryzae]KAI6253214.1 hypothetical protein MCOR19_010215 [Pyricularia oryzae]KAI6265676.1 hypothetical protein MCOR26_010604 [Pyricularia oryzae]